MFAPIAFPPKTCGQSAVGHDRCHDGSVLQDVSFLKAFGKDIKNAITINNMAVFIHGNTTVGVSVKGKSHVQMVLLYQTAKLFCVCGAAAEIDVQ